MKPDTNPTKVTLMFPDGVVISGPTAEAVLTRLGSIQWTPMDSMQMRRLLAHRAYEWDGTVLDARLPPAAFLRSLSRSTLVVVIGK